MAKSKKNKNKPKLNLTVRDEQRNKLEQMASSENRSVSSPANMGLDSFTSLLFEASNLPVHARCNAARKLR